MSHASASSRRLWNAGSQRTFRPLRANETSAPMPGGPAGMRGCRRGASATPGVSDGPGPKISRWMRFAVIPQPARPSVTSCMKRAARICRSRHCAVSRAPGAHPCLNAPERQIPDPACLRERENCTRCGCGRGPKLLRERGSPRQKGAHGRCGLHGATRLPSATPRRPTRGASPALALPRCLRSVKQRAPRPREA